MYYNFIYKCLITNYELDGTVVCPSSKFGAPAMLVLEIPRI